MDKFEELKNEFQAVGVLLEAWTQNEDSFSEFVSYYLAMSLRVWGRNKRYSEDYAKAFATILGISIDQDLVDLIINGLKNAGKVETLPIPPFFASMVKQDVERGTYHSSLFVHKLNALLTTTALINGDFTIDEANEVSTLSRDLARYASDNGRPFSIELYELGDVTPLDESSYIQSLQIDVEDGNPEEKKSAAAKNKESDEKNTNNKEDKPKKQNKTGKRKKRDKSESTITIPVTISFSGSSSGEDFAHSSESGNDYAPAIEKPEERSKEKLDSLLSELDELVGLEGVKQDVHSLMNFITVSKLRKERGMKVPTISYHLVFTGNPGTGKTTVARLIAKLYYQIGILPKGQMIETDRSALVAGYLGQTAIKTQKVIQQAMGGVLFIDEAYSLAGETDDSYGREAIETLLKAMEDHRDELVVIVAGYTELMHKFIDSNPGLSSRFSKYFEFPDYKGEELMAIFERFCQNNGYSLDDGAATTIREQLNELYENRDERFGNARTARNIFEKAINAQADRVAQLKTITNHDLEFIAPEDVCTV